MNFCQKILILIPLAVLPFCASLSGQSWKSSINASADAEKIVSQNMLREDLDFLSGDFCKGRGVGQAGNSEAGFWLSRFFRANHLMPMDGSMCQSFSVGDRICHNIVGMIPQRNVSDGQKSRYVIIMSHYDNLGEINGKVYPGADSNSSGVAAMVSLVKMLKFISDAEGGLPQNIIFAGLDGKQLSLAGSQDLWSRIALERLHNPVTGGTVKRDEVSMVVNLDILGGVSSPISPGNKNFLIMLGGEKYKGLLHNINIHTNGGLEVALDYYGSKGFTDLFLNRVSDQRPFRENNVYSVMFTSGITMDTNRDTDTPDKIDFEVLEKRIILIYRWIERMIYLNR